jgi:hypothetical protein
VKALIVLLSAAALAPAAVTPNITFAVTKNPSSYCETLTFTVTVSGTSAAAPVPTGSVTLLDGSTPLRNVPLANGVGVIVQNNLTAGTHALTAAYSGDQTYLPTSAARTQTVTPAATTLSLRSSPNPSALGQSVTLTATLTPTSCGAAGTVTFLDGAASLGTANLSGAAAIFSVNTLAVGSHTLTARYSGDANNTASTSNAVTQSVGGTPGSITLTATPASSTYGQPVALAARVTPATAVGTVTFKDAGAAIGTAPLSGGAAGLTVSTLSAGTHSLTAAYSGDAANAASESSAVTVTVAKAGTATALTASPNPSSVGQAVTITATVTPATATGTMRFLDGATVIGTAAVNGGTAAFTTSALTQGTHSLSASYAGDNNHNGSNSASVTQTVNALTITGPASLPAGTVGAAYPPQTFTATGGSGNFKWSLSGASGNLSISDSGISAVLSGTPQMAGSFQMIVQVTDNGTGATASRSYALIVNFPALPPISLTVNAQPTTPSDQPVAQFSLGQAYPLALRGTFQLTFTPNAAALPANYTNAAVQFATGGTLAQVSIPANSTTAVALPAVQIGSVAGTIDVRLTSLVNSSTGQPVPLPSQAPAATITVPRTAPVIVPGSVKIANVTASGFQVTFDAVSTPRDLARANITFSAAQGTQLTGTQSFAVALDTAAATWFPSAAGVSAGGAFSVVVTFGYTGDTSAIGAASVTATNSVGTSAAVSGGR